MSVVVADDELPFRGRFEAFNWQACGAVLVGTAKNGAEALEMCRRHQPDLLITDIVMPVMDGLQLQRQLRQEQDSLQVVILTVHERFEYAQRALRLGALDYLLKMSLGEREIESVIEKARTQLKRWDHDPITGHDNLSLEIAAYFHGPDRRAPEELTRKAAERVGTNGPFRSGLLSFPRASDDDLIIQQELVDVSAGVAPTAALVSLAGGRILVLEPPDNPNFHRSLSEVFQEVCRRVPYASKPPTCAFVDCGIAGLSRAYDVWNTPDLLETLTFLSDGICRYDVDSCASFGKGNPTASNHRWPQDDRGVESLRRALLPRGLIETMAEAYLTGGPRYYSEQELAELRRELRRQWTLCDLVAFVRSHEQDSPHKKGRLEVRRAVSIMEAEFAEPIGLEYVASKVGLSSAYFSRLFRSETGEQFGSRLLRIRVEQAIRLLQSTTMKVYEVAERVGIPNYRYFSVVFKKVTGRQPKEYQGKG